MRVILTGANSGLGFEFVKFLLKKKIKVIAVDKELKNLCKIKNTNLNLYNFDLENFREYPVLLKKILKKFKIVDCLINNVRYQQQFNFEQETPETWDKTISINLKSYFFLSKEFIRFFKKKKIIRIINISSIADEFVTGQSPSYHSSKSGIKILTKYLATINKNVICNSISPGFIIKPRSMKFFSKKKIDKKNKFIQNIHPGERVGSPQDVFKVLYFFLNESPSFINGQNIKVDGGLSNIEHTKILKNLF